MPFTPNAGHAVDNTELRTWFERDRSHVALYSQYATLLIEWWDGAVQEAIDDGFLRTPRRHPEDKHALHESALKYYMENCYPSTGISYHPGEECYRRRNRMALEVSILNVTDRGTLYQHVPHLFFGAQVAIQHQLRINDSNEATATVQRIPVRGRLEVYVLIVPTRAPEVYTDRHEAHLRYEALCKDYSDVELYDNVWLDEEAR